MDNTKSSNNDELIDVRWKNQLLRTIVPSCDFETMIDIEKYGKIIS